MKSVQLFIDEAGNSGSNLSVRNQPIYVLASSAIGEAEAKGLLPSIPASNFHFVKAWKSVQNRGAICTSLENLANRNEVRVWIIDKITMASTLMFELMRPLFGAGGFDPIANGGVHKFHSILVEEAPTILGELHTQLIDTFTEVCRRPSEEAADRFIETLRTAHTIAASRPNNAVRDLLATLGLVAVARRTALIFLQPGLVSRKDMLNPAGAALLSLLAYWSDDPVVGEVSVLHDRGPDIERMCEEMKPFWDQQRPPFEVERSDGSVARYPLSLPGGVHFAPAATSPGIQLADLTASAIARILRADLSGSTSPEVELLRSTGILSRVVGRHGPPSLPPYEPNLIGLDGTSQRLQDLTDWAGATTPSEATKDGLEGS